MNVIVHQFNDALFPVVSTSTTPEGAVHVQVNGPDGYLWLKPSQYEERVYNAEVGMWVVPVTCEYPSARHSDDLVNVWHGRAVPTVLCGYHASQVGPELFKTVAAHRRSNRD